MKLVALILLFVCLPPSSIFPQTGESEIIQLMADRPTVGAIIKSNKPLRTWLIKAFDGQFSKSKIRWRNDDSNLPNNVLGHHDYYDGYATVTVSHQPCPIDQLTILIYECVNVRSEPTFRRLCQSAAEGRIPREDFVTKIMETEHQAFLGAQPVIRQNLPLTRKESAGTDIYREVMRVPHDFTKYLQYYEKVTKDGFDIRDHYRTLYDKLVSKRPLPPLRFD